MQRSRTPVLTMVRKVPDLIVGVDERAIYVESEAARTNDQTAPVARGQIAAIWEDLTAKDRTTSTADPQIAHSLVGTLIEGIGYKAGPFRLVVTNRDRANQGWRDPAVATSELAEGLDAACAKAATVTAAMDVTLAVCRLDGWDAVVEVNAAAMAALGSAHARARAGPVQP